MTDFFPGAPRNYPTKEELEQNRFRLNQKMSSGSRMGFGIRRDPEPARDPIEEYVRRAVQDLFARGYDYEALRQMGAAPDVTQPGSRPGAPGLPREQSEAPRSAGPTLRAPVGPPPPMTLDVDEAGNVYDVPPTSIEFTRPPLLAPDISGGEFGKGIPRPDGPPQRPMQIPEVRVEGNPGSAYAKPMTTSEVVIAGPPGRDYKAPPMSMDVDEAGNVTDVPPTSMEFPDTRGPQYRKLATAKTQTSQQRQPTIDRATADRLMAEVMQQHQNQARAQPSVPTAPASPEEASVFDYLMKVYGR